MAHHYGPNLCPEAIELNRSRRQVPEKLQRQEMSSTTSTELQPVLIPEREEDQQQKDHHSSPENYIFKEIWQKCPNVQGINWKNHLILDLFAYHESFCFPSIKNSSNLHTVTRVSAQDSQAANVSPNNNSLDGFNNQTGTFILSLIERLKQSKDDDKMELDIFIDVMKLHLKKDKLIIPAVEASEPLQSLLDGHQKKHGVEKQYAFAIVLLKGGKIVISPVFYPRHSDQIGDTLHSEEILIKELERFLWRKGRAVEQVFIYTHNSPCMKREKQHIDPCMFLLLKKAYQWHNKYGFITVVAFKEFWGISRRDFFNYVKDIPSSNRVFYPYVSKCDSIPFPLDWKDFDKLKPGQIQNLKDVEARNRQKLYEDIRSVLDNLKGSAETSFGLKTDHLERGEKMIVQSLDHFQDQDIRKNIFKTLRKKWVEMVNNSFLSLIRKTLTADFNAAQVHLAVNDLQLGNNSPLQLYHILDRNQNMLN